MKQKRRYPECNNANSAQNIYEKYTRYIFFGAYNESKSMFFIWWGLVLLYSKIAIDVWSKELVTYKVTTMKVSELIFLQCEANVKIILTKLEVSLLKLPVFF